MISFILLTIKAKSDMNKQSEVVRQSSSSTRAGKGRDPTRIGRETVALEETSVIYVV